MSDLIEDLFAFLATTGESVVCSRCGRQLAEGEQYTLDEDNQLACSDCEEVQRSSLAMWSIFRAGM